MRVAKVIFFARRKLEPESEGLPHHTDHPRPQDNVAFLAIALNPFG